MISTQAARLQEEEDSQFEIVQKLEREEGRHRELAEKARREASRVDGEKGSAAAETRRGERRWNGTERPGAVAPPAPAEGVPVHLRHHLRERSIDASR